MNDPGIVVGRGGLSVRVSSPFAADLLWLRDCLTPGFSVAEGLDAEWALSVSIDADAYQRWISQGPTDPEARATCFSFDGQSGNYPVWSESPPLIHDPELAAFYRIAPAQQGIQVLAGEHRPSLRVALLRWARELATLHLARQGWAQIHAAALCHAGRGVLICGPKRAGKTSLSIAALQQPATRFISNDRALICRDQVTGAMMLAGMPTIIAIREGTLRLFESLPFAKVRHWRARLTLEEVLAQPGLEPGVPTPATLDLNPRQFCHLLGVRAVAAAPLHALLFPRVDTARTGIKLRPLEGPEMLKCLQGELLPPKATVLTDPIAGDHQVEACGGLLTELSGLYPGFECIIGTGAFEQPEAIRDMFNNLETSATGNG